MGGRKAKINRSTDNSRVKVSLDLDGQGNASVETGIPFLDQMLLLFARQAGFDLEAHCQTAGTDPAEAAGAVGFCLGLAFEKALGGTKGPARGSHSYAAVEGHLARAVVECSGHPCLVHHARAALPSSFGLDPKDIVGFWQSFVGQARITLHIELLHGGDGMPAFEAMFKATARALSGIAGSK